MCISCCFNAAVAEPWQQTDSVSYFTSNIVLACKAHGRAEQSARTLPQTNGDVRVHYGTFDLNVQFCFHHVLYVRSNWYPFNSHARRLGSPWEPRGPKGGTQHVLPGLTHGPAPWWRDPPAQLQRKSLRTSTAWSAKATTMRNMMSQ